MDFNIDVRRVQLESLDQFISSSREKVENILKTLDWTAEEVIKDSSLTKCTINSNHRVPVNTINEHTKKCSLKNDGYDLKEIFLSEPLHDPKSSILIDDSKKVELIAEARTKQVDFKTAWNGQESTPKTADRNIATYSSDERLTFYDYSVQNTAGPPELPEFNIYTKPSNEDKPLTYEEELAQKRDSKRRRIKYKSVHTNHKSYKEVMHEVIEGQMELYKDWLTENKEVKSESNNDTQFSNNDKEENMKNVDYNRSTISRNSTHSSSSRETIKESNGSKYKEDRWRCKSHSKERLYDYKKRKELKYNDYKEKYTDNHRFSREKGTYRSHMRKETRNFKDYSRDH